jgi:aldehyde dehydrogenase (NAD+)
MKVFDTVKDAVVSAWSAAYRNPLDENNHVGPLIDTHAVEMYNNAAKLLPKVEKLSVEAAL